MKRISNPTGIDWPNQLEDFVRAAVGSSIMWDFDGVIADTEPIHELSYREVLAPFGITLTNDYFTNLIGKTEREIWTLLLAGNITDLNLNVATLTTSRQKIVLNHSLRQLSPCWFVRDLVNEFSLVSKSQTIVSNGNPNTISTLLRAWSLDTIISMPDQKDSNLTKRELIKKLASSGQSIIIEDNAGYLRFGRDNGAFAIAIEHSMNCGAQFEDVVRLVI